MNIKQKVVLRKILSDYLSQEKVTKALALFEHRYSQRPDIPVDAFVSECVRLLALDIRQDSLKQRLMQANHLLSAKQSSPTTQAGDQAKEAHASPHEIVFESFIKGIVHMLSHKGVDAHALFLFLAKETPVKTLSPEAQLLFAQWCDTSGASTLTLASKLSFEQMSGMLHVVYVWLCNALGPVETDQLFARVIAVIEKRPEANSAPPREFL